MSPRRSHLWRWALVPLAMAVLAVLGSLWLAQGGWQPFRVPGADAVAEPGAPASIERGAYLARIGGCVTCHSRPGGTALAGGRAFSTPYGTLYSSNLSSDAEHGIGGWSLAQFRHAIRHGVAPRGPLYPVFPYANFALLAPADVDDLYAYLRSLPAVAEPVPAAQLDFPASWRWSLLGWRLWDYRPLPALRGGDADPLWQRGRYLVEAVGHCSMCHSRDGERGSLGRPGHLAGTTLATLGWYAPALDSSALARFDQATLADYLRSGNSRHGAAYGPMAEAVAGGLQALREDDAQAMARYLLSLPAQSPQMPAPERLVAAGDPGAVLYRRHCADCHGQDGEGDGLRYPPLRDAVAVRATDPVNAVRMVLAGGLAPATPGNPRPYSMPPFAHQLDSAEVAAVVGYIRARWGGHREALGTREIDRLRGLGAR